jgi:pyrroline-5-carboxylate reductase
MIDLKGELLLVGCGRMGGALLDGWLAQGLAGEQVAIVEPNEAAHAALEARGCRCTADAAGLPDGFQPALVLFAVKPLMMDALLPDYRRFRAEGVVFLSIAAGRNIASFERALGAGAAVVRAMPNTPAAVGRGMTVLVANSAVNDRGRGLCGDLMRAVGETAWIEDEALLDAVTAVSGSGPAYVFHLVECLASAGRGAGLPEDLAMLLARTTVTGAGELLHRSDDTAERLRINVTSPAGTTEAALKVLMAEPGLGDLMSRAVEAAARRGRELAD